MKRRESILGPCADTPRTRRAAARPGPRGRRKRPRRCQAPALREQLVHPRLVAAIDGCQQLTQRTCPRPSTGKCAAAEEAELSGRARLDLVPRARRDEDGIARADLPLVACHLHPAGAPRHHVDLLGSRVIVTPRPSAGRERRLGQALLEAPLSCASRRTRIVDPSRVVNASACTRFRTSITSFCPERQRGCGGRLTLLRRVGLGGTLFDDRERGCGRRRPQVPASPRFSPPPSSSAACGAGPGSASLDAFGPKLRRAKTAASRTSGSRSRVSERMSRLPPSPRTSAAATGTQVSTASPCRESSSRTIAARPRSPRSASSSCTSARSLHRAPPGSPPRSPRPGHPARARSARSGVSSPSRRSASGRPAGAPLLRRLARKALPGAQPCRPGSTRPPAARPRRRTCPRRASASSSTRLRSPAWPRSRALLRLDRLDLDLPGVVARVLVEAVLDDRALGGFDLVEAPTGRRWGASFNVRGSVAASAAIARIASTNSSRVSFASVSVGSIIKASGTISGK